MTEKNNSLYAKAVILAYERHKGQERKVNGEQYINHPLRVSELIIQNFPDHKRLLDIRIVALLHDLLEDTNTTKKELEEKFGEKIAELVVNLTEDKKILDKDERHKEHLKKLKIASDDAKIVKLCDIADNVSTVNEEHRWKGYLARSKITLENINVKENKEEFEKLKEQTLKKIQEKDKLIKNE